MDSNARRLVDPHRRRQKQQPPPQREEEAAGAAGTKQKQQEENENDDEGGVLCGPGCINRSLNVECTPATCRFAKEGRCRNQRITKREVRCLVSVS